MWGLENIAGLVGLGGGGFIALRYIFKLLRSDYQAIKHDDKQESINDQYRDLYDRTMAELQEQRERADMFQNERNNAIAEVGKLRGEVTNLTFQVESMKVQIEQLTKTIELLNKICQATNPTFKGMINESNIESSGS